MEGSVPKENPQIVQSSEKPTQDLHTGVSQQLQQAGHPATPQSVDPEDRSSLNGIKEALGDTTHVVGSTFEELVGGTTGTTYTRTTGGKVPISIEVARRLKRRFLGRKAA